MSASKKSGSEKEVYPWMFRDHPVAENVKLAVGTIILVIFLPYTAVQVFLCTAWDFVDRKTINGQKLISKYAKQIGAAINKKYHLVSTEADEFMIPESIWLGVVLPAWFFYELYLAATQGFVWQRVVLYNIVRIGPMYANFMYTYVLAHKEGHNVTNFSLFSQPTIPAIPIIDSGVKSGQVPLFRNFYNGWVGFFHGVLPGCFTISHVRNHHKYDNNERDVYSTAYRPRDSFANWVKYLPEWMMYATNISSIFAFIEEGNHKYAVYSFLWNVYYGAMVYGCWRIHAGFTFTTVIYALFEGNILLSAVNWVWHAFIEPEEPNNDYINSITIVEGLNFTLYEEYHAVHHQYAGVHWTKNEELYQRHLDGYKKTLPSAFYKCNIFEVWGNICFQNYENLAKFFYKPMAQGKSEKELQEILKRRLRAHGPEIAKLQGKRGSNVEVVRDGEVVSTN